ncbi:hypothetical protein N7468_006163 [Penicillium chermesinum]|uniref:HTH psq-type domain-containing protein n=1 Tax=Penicillium chermesinum TaxID=63820 RepID=A0A9W9NS67_9EURO|nr:uncharacterized protein N7468_006163 [Penicillium chermesinum]KAJ5224938.1 hypothetical protein N7468_006163 [Penicillium chermesinum]
MPKSSNFSEDRMAKAVAFAIAEKKPNISKIAREFDVSRETLNSRIKKAKSSPTPKDSHRNNLRAFQEKALINWIVKMHSWNLPPTAAVIEA